jgi:hypothetical protein
METVRDHYFCYGFSSPSSHRGMQKDQERVRSGDHTLNPSSSGGIDKNHGWKPSQAKLVKQTKNKRLVAQLKR